MLAICLDHIPFEVGVCLTVGFSFAACLAGYTGYGYEIAAAVDLIAFCCVGISSLNDEKEPR